MWTYALGRTHQARVLLATRGCSKLPVASGASQARSWQCYPMAVPPPTPGISSARAPGFPAQPGARRTLVVSHGRHSGGSSLRERRLPPTTGEEGSGLREWTLSQTWEASRSGGRMTPVPLLWPVSGLSRAGWGKPVTCWAGCRSPCALGWAVSAEGLGVAPGRQEGPWHTCGRKRPRRDEGKGGCRGGDRVSQDGDPRGQSIGPPKGLLVSGVTGRGRNNRGATRECLQNWQMTDEREDSRLWSLEAQSGARGLRADVILKEGKEEMAWKGQRVRVVGVAGVLSGRKWRRSRPRAHWGIPDVEGVRGVGGDARLAVIVHLPGGASQGPKGSASS